MRWVLDGHREKVGECSRRKTQGPGQFRSYPGKRLGIAGLPPRNGRAVNTQTRSERLLGQTGVLSGVCQARALMARYGGDPTQVGWSTTPMSVPKPQVKRSGAAISQENRGARALASLRGCTGRRGAIS
jgi:hypothetical protein